MSALIIDEVALVLQLAERGAETLTQQFRDEAAQRLVPRPRGHRAGDLGQAIPAPTVHHCPLMSIARTVAGAGPKA